MKKILLKIWNSLSHNIGLKLFAVISAFIIWMVVANSINPMDTESFYNVPVQIINQDSLTEKDKIPAVVYGNEINITIRARKSICDAITADDIVAVADCEKIYVTDTVPIDISFIGYDADDIEIIKGRNQYMKLSLEEYATKEFKIKVETEGAPAEGYVVSNSVSSPNVITVRGSKTQVSRIQSVGVKVNVNGLMQDSVMTLEPIIYDADDLEMNKDNFELSTSEVLVTTGFYRTKKVALQVNTIGEVAKGYEIKSISLQPAYVYVAGTDSDLAKLSDTVSVNIDVTGRKTNLESNIDILSLIDNELSSIRIADEDTILAVTVYIDEKESKELPIGTEDVDIVGVRSGLVANAISISLKKILVRCTKDALPLVTTKLANPYIDLSQVTEPGLYEFRVMFSEVQDIEVLNDVTVKVLVNTQDQ